MAGGTASGGPEALELVEEGLREARAVSHPIMRLRHLHAWALRLSAAAPERAFAMADELTDDAGEQAQFLLTVLRDRLRTGGPELGAGFDQALARLRAAPPADQPRLLSDLSEVAVEVGDRDQELGRALVLKLVPVVEELPADEPQQQQSRALACALIGEALLMVGGEERGVALLREAESLSRDLPGREALAVFMAGALAGREPAWAAELAGGVEQLETRLDLRVQLLEKVRDAEVRAQVLEAALADAARLDQMQHLPLSQALVRLGLALSVHDPAVARELFGRALEEGREGAEGAGQTRALQVAGVATALTAFDRDWAGTLFREAVAEAGADEDRLKRVTTQVLIANEMAESHPRDAAEVLQAAVGSVPELDAMWEYAHLLDLLFHAERSPYLDLSCARPLLEGALARVSDEDPRVPGVFGLPELGRYMAQLDPERAADVFRRWFRAAEEAADTDGMIQAALLMWKAAPEGGMEALRQAREHLASRVDCPAMGEFCRSVAPVAPELALELAPQIQDPRERVAAESACATELHAADPARSLALIRALPQPADRSSALLAVVDRLLHTGDRYAPQPLLEDMV